ncbi:MAG TPA: helix-turn-helix domain-containing GNAT family N-acetyltransferase [Saprospiraceae bacterium]|nr:helix-turn-helix domain-containing GNAT family N-acetyltransferase [Saprospiraceae bacterium]HMQ83279.1 helix-turn-helix domain-containing GNAT family N-acetyltransferase [Saprospiraceae bacterium]
MEFFKLTGKKALGSRLRLMSEVVTADAAKIYELYGVALQPKWFPVFFLLTQNETYAITELATAIGHSHASVSNIVKEMRRNGLVEEKKDALDKRRNLVQLTEKGRGVGEKIKDQYEDVGAVIEDISSQTRHNLWEAMEEWTYLLEQKSLYERVRERRKQRESERVQILDYEPRFQGAFKALNEEWIARYFQMEAADYKALDHPQEYILDKEGHIFMAILDGEVVGTCGMIKMDDPDYDFELAKMAVSPKAQGKNIGWLLGNAVIERARKLGAKGVYLESNTLLEPAIRLYQKLGFVKIVGRSTPYARCNIQMGLRLLENH